MDLRLHKKLFNTHAYLLKALSPHSLLQEVINILTHLLESFECTVDGPACQLHVLTNVVVAELRVGKSVSEPNL